MSKKIVAYAIAATIMAANGGAVLAQDATAMNSTTTSESQNDNDGDEGKMGLLGLLGLAGLLGLKRRDNRHDNTNNR